MGSFFSRFSDRRLVPPQHQVFINFRGDELRNDFIGHLVDALREEGVNVFVDQYEMRGTRLNHLFRTIEESRIALTIFSRRYTESEWCLDELVRINECMNEGSLLVIPVFFNVEPRDVRLLIGPFGDNFWNPAFRFQANPERVERWNQALQSISQVSGLCYTNFRRQRDLVRSIVQEVKRVLIDIARSEEMVADVARNYFVTMTKEVTKSVMRYLGLILVFSLALGPYVIAIFWLLAFFYRSF